LTVLPASCGDTATFGSAFPDAVEQLACSAISTHLVTEIHGRTARMRFAEGEGYETRRNRKDSALRSRWFRSKTAGNDLDSRHAQALSVETGEQSMVFSLPVFCEFVALGANGPRREVEVVIGALGHQLEGDECEWPRHRPPALVER
jgi:hypothetical protein